MIFVCTSMVCAKKYILSLLVALIRNNSCFSISVYPIFALCSIRLTKYMSTCSTSLFSTKTTLFAVLKVDKYMIKTSPRIGNVKVGSSASAILSLWNRMMSWIVDRIALNFIISLLPNIMLYGNVDSTIVKAIVCVFLVGVA